ncbi:type III-B CRISPR module RAMP protein Cmr4 [Cyanothece sp. BG0011]|uniref:type III-B CRISPR module RAMP protein Cmr4 n=1 Tax=Cyanothece sp. BG0011 TaxID=2082950 RepID=UPI000D1EBF17|nr:type III-B CRISPR module RAMP protein Cmr4 [Cyanothece sp. BG0011]
MTTYLTYSYLLTPLHTGASSQAGNLMGIAREVQTEFPYLPSSSIRGKIRSTLELLNPKEAGMLFGEKIKNGNQPTEGEVWFVDATLLLFPVASLSHQFLWITCPFWLSRWNRWLNNEQLTELIKYCATVLNQDDKMAVSAISKEEIYLQGAILNTQDVEEIPSNYWDCFKDIPDGSGILDLQHKLLILSNDDCATFVEMGLQREVRIALDENKIVDGGSFRSEEAIPSETIFFFPWGLKANKDESKTANVRESLKQILNDRLQFGGLEGLGRGWTENKTIEISQQG